MKLYRLILVSLALLGLSGCGTGTPAGLGGGAGGGGTVGNGGDTHVTDEQFPPYFIEPDGLGRGPEATGAGERPTNTL